MRQEKIGDLLFKFPRKRKIPVSEYADFGQTPVIDQSSDTQIAGYTDDPDARHEQPLPITIFGDHTRVVKFADFPFASGADGTQLLYPNTEDIDPAYFYYAVSNVDLSNYFYARHFKFLKEQKIYIPKLPVQERIAEVLLAYDELIENNRRRMALLEESARLLYSEWFVRLRFPGYEHTHVTDGVPEGWEKAKVGTLLAKVVKGKKIQRNDYLVSGQIPCIDQGVDFIGGYTDDEEARIVNPLPLVVFGDHTRIFKFVNFPFAIGADGTQLICPNTSRISPEYFYFALKAIDLSNYFYARHFKFLKEESILIPVESLVREFSKFAGANFEQINYLRMQSQKLRAARDLLLPRLMSGEIAV